MDRTRGDVPLARPPECRPTPTYLMCLLTSFVISNIETLPLPPNTGLSLSSALIMRRSFASWRLFFLMYCQSFFVISVRGIGLPPTTALSAASGCIGFMNAAFGVRFAPPFFAAFFAPPPLLLLFLAPPRALAPLFFAPDFFAAFFPPFFAAILSPGRWNGWG